MLAVFPLMPNATAISFLVALPPAPAAPHLARRETMRRRLGGGCRCRECGRDAIGDDGVASSRWVEVESDWAHALIWWRSTSSVRSVKLTWYAATGVTATE